MGMPKVKPDNVVRHEIVLGRADRELLEGAIAAYQINRISTPLVALLSDASALLALAAILEATGIIDFIPNSIRQNLEEGLYGTYQELTDAIAQAQQVAQDISDAAQEAAAVPGAIVDRAELAAKKAAAQALKMNPVTGLALAGIWFAKELPKKAEKFPYNPFGHGR